MQEQAKNRFLSLLRISRTSHIFYTFGPIHSPANTDSGARKADETQYPPSPQYAFEQYGCHRSRGISGKSCSNQTNKKLNNQDYDEYFAKNCLIYMYK
jgi:hypothetical protein